MHIFVTGGSGQTGPAIVQELIAAGHSVLALARSDASAARLKSSGAVPFPGSLEELGKLADGAGQADGVIHMAFGGDFADPEDMTRRDVAAIQALGGALTGSGKPFVSTSGTLVMRPGTVAVEQDDPDPASIAAFRVPGEQACLSFAEQGVRSSVVRLAPTVHGPHDIGFIPGLIDTARRSGVSAYVNDGENRWPAVHRSDAATLFRLALEKAPAGSVLHGVAESGVPLRSIAEKIASTLGIPPASLTPEQAGEHFGNPFMAVVYGMDSPVSSAYTRRLLGWTPTHSGLLDDLDESDYFDAPVS